MKISNTFRKYAYWSLSFVSILVILFSVYYHLGGFKQVEIGRISNPYYSLAGKWLKGEVSKKEEGTVFNEIRDLILYEKVKGTLCMVDYKNDTLAENEMCRFVGIMLENEINSIPNALDVVEISAQNSYQAVLIMHPLVMPNTQKTEQQIVELAATYKDELEDFTMEMYFEDNSVIVQMFVK